jgi:hypothetical protein
MNSTRRRIQGRTAKLSPERAKNRSCLSWPRRASCDAGKTPSRAWARTSVEMSVAKMRMSHASASTVVSKIDIAMLYGSWPVEQPALHTCSRRRCSRSRAATRSGMTVVSRAWNWAGLRKNAVSWIETSFTRAWSSPGAACAPATRR